MIDVVGWIFLFLVVAILLVTLGVVFWETYKLVKSEFNFDINSEDDI